jgi:hypothetical protein
MEVALVGDFLEEDAATPPFPPTMPTFPSPSRSDEAPPVRIDFPGGTTIIAAATDPAEPQRPAPRADLAELLRLDGPHAGELQCLRARAVQIGRHASSDLRIDDPGISRDHACIYQSSGVHWIDDLGSLNGTYVRGRRVERCWLRDGDWIQLGSRVCFRYKVRSATPVSRK